MRQDPRHQVTPELLAHTFSFLELMENPVVQSFIKQPQVNLIPKLHRIVKQQRRALAKKYHPDLNPKHAERFKKINNACDILLTLRYQPPEPPPATVIYVYSFGGGVDSGNQTTSSATFF